MPELENRFTVLKNSDIDKYLSPRDHYLFRQIVGEIWLGREADGKKSNNYVVVNLDEPYAQQVVDLILQSGNKLPLDEFKIWRDKEIIWMKHIEWGFAVPLGDNESILALSLILNSFLNGEEIKRWPLDKE